MDIHLIFKAFCWLGVQRNVNLYLGLLF